MNSKNTNRSPMINLKCFDDIEIDSSIQFTLPSIKKVKLAPSFEDRSNLINCFDRILVDCGYSANVKTTFLGDVESHDSWHNLPQLRSLKSSIEKYVLKYIDENFSFTQLSVYYQKSWPVIMSKGNKISSHRHNNAHLSAVYYLDCPCPYSGGELIFESHTDYFPSLPTALQPKNNFVLGIRPFTNLLIIFPASLRHSVTSYCGNKPRLSISFDFYISGDESLSFKHRENISSDPHQWLPFMRN